MSEKSSKNDRKVKARVALPEEITFTPIEQQSYDSAWMLLNQSSATFFAPFPSLVNTDEVTFQSALSSSHHQKKKKAKQFLTSSSSASINPLNVSNYGVRTADSHSNDFINQPSSYVGASLSTNNINRITGSAPIDSEIINDRIHSTGAVPTVNTPAVPPPHISTTIDAIDFDDDDDHNHEHQRSTTSLLALEPPPETTRVTTTNAALSLGFDGMNADNNNNSSTVPPTPSIEATIATTNSFVSVLNNTSNSRQYSSGRRHGIRIANQQQPPLFPSILVHVDDNDTSSGINVSLATPGRGQNELEASLKKLEQIEKDNNNQSLLTSHQCDLTRQLTELITGNSYQSSNDAMQQLELIGQTVPRRVCQHPFKKNDIVWVCRTCQADETCVLCHTCFSQSNHEGHDVAFYHAQAGGCCDCGDPDGTFTKKKCCLSQFLRFSLRLGSLIILSSYSYTKYFFENRYFRSFTVCQYSMGSEWILSSSWTELEKWKQRR
jgi:Putative zinc finger in N-recognin (UBR box)